MDKPDNISQEDWQDLLRNPNDFLCPIVLQHIRNILFVKHYTQEAVGEKSDVLDLIIKKIDKTIEECRKPIDEPKEHHIVFHSGEYTTDLRFSINELHQIDHCIEDYIYPKIMEPEYVKWQRTRVKILNEIISRFK